MGCQHSTGLEKGDDDVLEEEDDQMTVEVVLDEPESDDQDVYEQTEEEEDDDGHHEVAAKPEPTRVDMHARVEKLKAVSKMLNSKQRETTGPEQDPIRSNELEEVVDSKVRYMTTVNDPAIVDRELKTKATGKFDVDQTKVVIAKKTESVRKSVQPRVKDSKVKQRKRKPKKNKSFKSRSLQKRQPKAELKCLRSVNR